MACSNEFPSSRPLPSTASAADRSALFGGFIGTMSRSDSRPQLSAVLRSSLALHPRWQPRQRTRSGLLGSEDDLSYVMRSTTPVERHRLAYRRCTCCLHGQEPTRPPRHSAFRSFTPHPARLLSTLRTLRYRNARKTRFWTACYGFNQTGLSPASHLQLCPAHPRSLLILA